MIDSAVAGPAAEAGYAIERERGALVVALPSVMEDVLALLRQHGTLHAAAAARPDAQAFTGRGVAYRMATTGGVWLVRHYQRGGAVAHVLKDEYLRAGEPRPLRELHASIRARARGVETPEVMAAIVYLAGPLYRADLATRFVADSRDLGAVLFGAAIERGQQRVRASTREPASTHTGQRADETIRCAAWRATGVLLRRAFAAGVEHPDLNARNILIAGAADAPRALLLDLDRAVVHEQPVSDALRSSMLVRLHRSRLKLERLAGAHTTDAEVAAFEAGLGVPDRRSTYG